MTGNERTRDEEPQGSRADRNAPRLAAAARVARRWLFRALAVTVSSLLTFSVFEFLVRALEIGPTFHVVFRETIRPSDNPVLGYELRPLAREGRSQISSTGLRDREYPLAKPDDVFRIAAIGDSVTYGSGGLRRTSWVERLEKLLNDRATPGAPRFEVINLGVPGYHIGQIAERLRVLGLAHEPDLIIYAYVLNDPQSFSIESAALKGLREAAEERYRRPLGSGVLRSLSHSRLFLMARHLITQSGSGQASIPELQRDPTETAFASNRLETYVRALHSGEESRGRLVRGMDDLAQLAGDVRTPILVAIFPLFFEEGSGAYPLEDVQAVVANEASSRGFAVTDLLTPLRAAREEIGEPLHLDFLHPNVAGNRVVAGALFEALCGKGLLPIAAVDCAGAREPSARRASGHPEISKGPQVYADSSRSARRGALGRDIDIGLIALRVNIAGLALLLLGFGLWSRRSGRPRRSSWWRKAAFGILAVVAFSMNYNFFLARKPHGLHRQDVYHYYLSSKYFPELGYFRLYECSIAALGDDRGAELARDLRSNRMTRIDSWSLPGTHCDGAFSAERWARFESDVRWFKDRLGAEKWPHVLTDHGYNPSPVWTLMGRPLASLFPAEDASMRLLARFDLLLQLVTFASIAWAFGFETMCIAAVAWGTIPYWRYSWMGDSFLRYAWFASSMIGICLLKKERYLGAGVLMSWSALLRLFPVMFIVGYVLKQLRLWWRAKVLERGFRRFVIGASVSGLVLLGAATVVSGRGIGTYEEFAAKLNQHARITSWMTIGLRPLLSHTSEKGAPVLMEGIRQIEQEQQQVKEKAFASRRIYYYATVLAFILLYWRALGAATDWEAAAMGFSLILVLLQPGAYYLSFMVVVALLASRRPRIGIALMAAAICHDLASIYHYQQNLEHILGSAIAIALSLYVLLEMQIPVGEPRTAREAAS
jgi:lysophospholipase L1-like esterase